MFKELEKVKTSEMEITIQKENTKDTVNYAITIEEKDNENARIYFKAEYSGLAAIQSVAENYEIELQYEANPILEYAQNSKIIHVDIEPAELNKNINVYKAVNADAKRFLSALLPKNSDIYSVGFILALRQAFRLVLFSRIIRLY